MAPEIKEDTVITEDYKFLIAVADSGLRRAVRPIRDCELFRMYGFEDLFAREALAFSAKDKLELL